MAHLRCDFYSDVLGLSTSMTVILPQQTATQIGLAGRASDAPPPVLYLLHGLSDDDTIWLRRTSIERYVAPLGLAVVMPQVGRSFYTDEAHGGRYWTFLCEELPAVVRSFFVVSDRREDTFVAGLSMGGYGALKWALRHPGAFAAAASLSGALDVAALQAAPPMPEDPTLMRRVFGEQPVAGGPEDLLALVGGADPEELPALYVCCGRQDPLHARNQVFVAACAEAGVPVTTSFDPGEHEWGYWDEKIQEVLAWLPLRT
ncbi:MAG TPA: alpha/beta hydrolase family protein [Actinomycetes bacterium]|nr:alpha/beta hydrolase family protein [Actinomycetes bacterium]